MLKESIYKVINDIRECPDTEQMKIIKLEIENTKNYLKCLEKERKRIYLKQYYLKQKEKKNND